MPTADERGYQMQTAALIRSSREPDGAKMTEKARTAFRQSFCDRNKVRINETRFPTT